MANDVLTEELSREQLLRAWERIDVPEGWRAEVRDGKIVMIPSPPSSVYRRIVNAVV
ncbi:hypothetical protein [Allosalinactinospora lopnorensis]|uniref:hypothetical protein n=1 Tax=Allosalinactinospora lopnorensis TaxID=1352348 RepID=UPI0012E2E55D|nr:hypothetical protein [Allosalinactinospora lopnorensis]